MEIRAYSELYIESAQNVLGHMFDFAINEMEIDPDSFAMLFATSPFARQIERGNPKFVAGMTGPELAKKIVVNAGVTYKDSPEIMYADRSPEYWGGWVLAYYQWMRDRSFADILNAVSYGMIIKMYRIYHEMDISKFVDAIDEKMAQQYPDTPLRRHRDVLNISQKELSQRADVPIRQIQLFEQRRRDIKKAQAITVLKLSKALECSVEDLLN